MSPYNHKSPLAIGEYTQYLVNKKFRSFLPENKSMYSHHKGGFGTLIEEKHFLYEANSEAAPDFADAGVELKVIPYKKNKNRSYSAKERLVLNIINYMKLPEETFETSSFWNKNKLFLLSFYLYDLYDQELDRVG